MRILLLILMGLSGLPPLFGDNPPPTAEDWQIHVQLTAVILTEKDALPLLDEFNDETKAAGAAEKAMAAVQRGAGELAGPLRTQLASGGTSKAESVKEIRYAVEFDEPDFPNLDSVKQVDAVPKDVPMIPLKGTTFEARNVGLALQVEGTASAGGRIISLRTTATHTRFLGWDETVAGRTPQGAKLSIQQPLFFTATDTLQIALRSGEQVLIGTHQWPAPDHRLELFILKAWTSPRPPAGEPKR